MGLRYPRTRLLKRSNALPAASSPTPAAPAQGVSLAFHLLHPVLRPSEQNEDVREKPKSDRGFCFPPPNEVHYQLL